MSRIPHQTRLDAASRIRPAALVGAMLFCAAGAAQATLVNYQDFSNLSAFTLNGATAGINTGGQGVVGPNSGDGRVLRLTNALTGC